MYSQYENYIIIASKSRFKIIKDAGFLEIKQEL